MHFNDYPWTLACVSTHTEDHFRSNGVIGLEGTTFRELVFLFVTADLHFRQRSTRNVFRRWCLWVGSDIATNWKVPLSISRAKGETRSEEFEETRSGNIDFRIQGPPHSTVQKEDDVRRETVGD